MEENGPQLGCDHLLCPPYVGPCGPSSIGLSGIATSRMASIPRQAANAAYTAAQSVVKYFHRIKCRLTTSSQWFLWIGLIIRCGWNMIGTNYYNASTARLVDYGQSARPAIKRRVWRSVGFGTNIGGMRK